MLAYRWSFHPDLSVAQGRSVRRITWRSHLSKDQQIVVASLALAARAGLVPRLRSLSRFLNAGVSMRAEPYDRQTHPPLLESLEILSGAAVILLVCAVWYVGTERYHLTDRQVAEIVAYAVISLTILGVTVILAATRRSRREMEWPHPPMVIPTSKNQPYTHQAWSLEAEFLGYDVHARPRPLPDSV